MSEKSKVAIVRCESYDPVLVTEAVNKGINLLGGAAAFVKHAEKIILKPNVLVGDSPEKLVGPHPAVFECIAKVFKTETENLYYGDSPGFGNNQKAYEKAQLSVAAEKNNIKTADFITCKEVIFKESPFTKKFFIAQGVLDADGLISISKMKTHGSMRITGAVKNQFGCVPGILKAEYHLKLPDPFDFAKMLVCLTLLVKPRLYIMDGITAMEGNGPRGGNPVNMKVLLFSTDPVALDAVMCRLINLNPELVATITCGKEYGLGNYAENEIELLGDSIKDLINCKFDVVRKPLEHVTTGEIISFFKNSISSRPVIDKEKCTKCGTCVNLSEYFSFLVNNQKISTTKHYNSMSLLVIRCHHL